MIAKIQYDIPESVYHSWPHLSNSRLTHMKTSPAHYYALNLHPERPQETPTAAMENGTVSHMMCLEPGRFLSRYQMTTLDRRGTKAWDEEAAGAAAIGKELMKEKDWTNYWNMMDALKANELVQKCLKGARTEASVTWEQNGRILEKVPSKARFDIWHDWGIIDVKTSADPENFEKSCVSYGYHRQAAWYQRAMEAFCGEKKPFSFLVFSTKYPYTVRVFSCSDEFIEAGNREIDDLLVQWEECTRDNSWPDRCGPFILNLPKWYGGNYVD
jgi:hypothetical protein